MSYIKLLTVLAGLALLTACGGVTAVINNVANCNTNAFHVDCKESDPAIMALRESQCLADTTIDPTCVGETGIATVFCKDDPFNTDCNAVETAIISRQNQCLGNENINPSCGGILTTYCEANPTEARCVVNTAAWLASFTANGGTAPPATPDATTRKDEFLAATATGFNTGANADIRATFGSPTEDIAIQTLTFAEAVTATGGVAFFGGELYTAGTSTGTDFYYAGVLAGTDLGAPITENITSAKWTGQIRANANIDGAIINVADGADFELDITFDGAKGTITTIFARGPQFVYEIDGMFDENGIITGSVDYGAGDTTSGINMASSVSSFYSPGTLTGIIGQNGAVGAFHSNNNTGVDQASFSGGFIALPPDPCVALDTCVDTADWLASFTGGDALTTTPDATPINEFLAITETTASSLTAVVPTTLFMTGSTTNGLAFFTENGAYYAGVLAGTNLGAPITAPITSARWEGEIRADSSGSAGVLTANPTDGFGLDITFDGTKGTMTTIFALSGGFVYEIDGMFDENGIITGSVDYGGGDTTNGISPTQFRAFYSPGTLRGIIGQDGAVGVFHSDNNNPEAGAVARSFAGGFVVTPPDPCIALGNCPVNHATWAQSFATELSATPTRQNKFIQGTADGFNSGDYDSTVLALNFNDVFTDGNMTDGFAYFNAGSHVAIFSGTDLGVALPLTQRASVEWSGFIRSSVGFTTATAFSLTVGFTGTGGTLDALIQSSIGTTLAYDIDGEFDAKGVITGNVTRGRYASSVSGCTPLTVGGNPNTSQTCFNSADAENVTATLSGIIGAEGAVGVFQGGNSYAGGFVAKPQ